MQMFLKNIFWLMMIINNIYAEFFIVTRILLIIKNLPYENSKRELEIPR
jgi:hypothetical protein